MRLVLEDNPGTHVPELILGARVVHVVHLAGSALLTCLLKADGT
jgi:hypothetical protein